MSHERQLKLPKELESLSKFLSFDEDMRSKVLFGLEVAAICGPRDDELRKSKSDPETQKKIDKQYENIADTFAVMIDEEFKKTGVFSTKKAVEDKSLFLEMIRGLSQEDITKGLKILRDAVPAAKAPKIDIIYPPNGT